MSRLIAPDVRPPVTDVLVADVGMTSTLVVDWYTFGCVPATERPTTTPTAVSSAMIHQWRRSTPK